MVGARWKILTLTSLLQFVAVLGLRYKIIWKGNAEKQDVFMNFKEDNVVVTSSLSEEERAQVLNVFSCTLRLWMILKTVTFTMMMMVAACQVLSITLTTPDEGGKGNACNCRQLRRSELAQLSVSELAVTVIFMSDVQP